MEKIIFNQELVDKYMPMIKSLVSTIDKTADSFRINGCG